MKKNKINRRLDGYFVYIPWCEPLDVKEISDVNLLVTNITDASNIQAWRNSFYLQNILFLCFIWLNIFII